MRYPLTYVNLIVFDRNDLNNIITLLGISKTDFYKRIDMGQSTITAIAQGRLDWNTKHLKGIEVILKSNLTILKNSGKIASDILNQDYDAFSYDLTHEDFIVPLLNKRFKFTETTTKKLCRVTSKKDFDKLVSHVSNLEYIASILNTIKRLPKILEDIEFYVNKSVDKSPVKITSYSEDNKDLDYSEVEQNNG
jgi:hypothetical protein